MVLPHVLRNDVLVMLITATVGCFLIDRLCVAVFAWDVFVAGTLQPIRDTRPHHVLPLLGTALKIVAAVVLIPVVLSNPLFIVGAWFAYGHYKKWREEQERKEVAEAARAAGLM
jgi:hypothetical protein